MTGHKHALARAGAAVVLGVVVGACGLTGPDAKPPAPTSRALGQRATTVTSTSTTAPAREQVPVPASDGVSASSISGERPGTESVEAVVACVNSFDQECGPVRFSPEPENLGIAATVTFSPERPHAGDKVTITVTATDPDAVPAVCTEPAYDDYGEDPPAANCAPPPAKPPPRGLWSPPAPTGTTRTFTFTHMFETFGTSGSEPVQHTFALTIRSYTDSWAAYPDPHESKAIARGTVYVTPTAPVNLPWL